MKFHDHKAIKYDAMVLKWCYNFKKNGSRMVLDPYDNYVVIHKKIQNSKKIHVPHKNVIHKSTRT